MSELLRQYQICLSFSAWHGASCFPFFYLRAHKFYCLLGIYCLEFILKLYAEPIGYWRSWFNFFDLTVLTITMVAKILRAQDSVDIPKLQGLRVLRALTAFRTLRTVSFIKGLQVTFQAPYRFIGVTTCLFCQRVLLFGWKWGDNKLPLINF